MKTPQLGFFSILGLIFITLKLTGVITWSWWLVLLPLYLGVAILAAIFLGGLALMALGIVVAVVTEFWLSRGK